MEDSTWKNIGDLILKEIAIGIFFSILAFVCWCCSSTFNWKKMENFLTNLCSRFPVVIITMIFEHIVLYYIREFDHQLPLLHSAFLATTFLHCFFPKQNDCEYIMSAVFSQILSSFALFVIGYVMKSFLLLFINSVQTIVIDVILTIPVFFCCVEMLTGYLKEQRQVF